MNTSDNTVELIGSYGGDETHALSAWTSTKRELTEEKQSRIDKLLKMLAELGEFERISEGFVKHNGGLAKIEREWFKKVAENKE